LLHELFAGQHAARAFRQCQQQCKLMAGDFTCHTVEPHRACGAVYLQPAEAQHIGRRILPAAPEDRAQARQQFARLKRLRQIIVCADFQTDDPVHRIAAGGQHQNRQG